MHLEDYDTEQRYTATVKDSIRLTPEETEEVRELILQVDSGDFGYQVGQCIGVIVPGPHALGHKDHFRLYSIANEPEPQPTGNLPIIICVKRCTYIDEYSGEAYKGIASNYLCDRRPGDQITITGPHELPFEFPEEKDANLLMIGLGTGIAPYRAFVKHIYDNLGGWEGKVRLFYGARTGLEMLYMNDKRDDFVNYYDEATFEAFKVVSPRPHWEEPIALEDALEQHQAKVWEMMSTPKTYVYVAGVESICHMLENSFSKMASSKQKWERRKAELVAGRRWMELIY